MDFNKSLLLPPFLGTSTRFSILGDLGFGDPAPINSPTVIQSMSTRTYFFPFYIPSWYPVKRMWVVNGSTVNGSLDLGIYSYAGTKIASTGSFAQSGMSSIQFANITMSPLAPGRYFFGIAPSSAGSVSSVSFGNGGTSCARLSNMYIMNSTFPLPAIIVPTFSSAMTLLWLMGMTVT